MTITTEIDDGGCPACGFLEIDVTPQGDGLETFQCGRCGFHWDNEPESPDAAGPMTLAARVARHNEGLALYRAGTHPHQLYDKAGGDHDRWVKLMREAGHPEEWLHPRDRRPDRHRRMHSCGYHQVRIGRRLKPSEVEEVWAYPVDLTPDEVAAFRTVSAVLDRLDHPRTPTIRIVEVPGCGDPVCGGDGGACPTCGHDPNKAVI